MKIMLENKHTKNLPAKCSNTIKDRNQAGVLLAGSLVLQHGTTAIMVSVFKKKNQRSKTNKNPQTNKQPK